MTALLRSNDIFKQRESDVFTIGAGVGISLIGKESRGRDLAIGIILTFVLVLGILFLLLYSGYAERVYAILFGDILGISQTDV